MDAKQKVSDPRAADTSGRRPYARPAVQWEEDFQPYVFSTCGKMPGQGRQCAVHRNS